MLRLDVVALVFFFFAKKYKNFEIFLSIFFLQHQMNPTSNFATYRQSLTAAMQRALSAQEGACDKIVIPFFSLLVKDLYFLNEGCSNKMPNGYLNFEVNRSNLVF